MIVDENKREEKTRAQKNLSFSSGNLFLYRKSGSPTTLKAIICYIAIVDDF
jgi:hypothetical protein